MLLLCKSYREQAVCPLLVGVSIAHPMPIAACKSNAAIHLYGRAKATPV